MIIGWHHWLGLTASFSVGKVRGRGPSGHDSINLCSGEGKYLKHLLDMGGQCLKTQGCSLPQEPLLIGGQGGRNVGKWQKMSGIACLAWKYGHKWKSPTGTQGKIICLGQEEGFRKVLKELFLEESFGVMFWGYKDTPSTSYNCIIPERSHTIHLCSTHFLNDSSKT